MRRTRTNPSIASLQQDYERQCIPEGMPGPIREMCISAFYAGAIAAIDRAGDRLDAEGLNPLRALFSDMVQEIKDWAEQNLEDRCDDD